MSKQSFTTGQVLTAAQVNSLQANDFNQTVSVKTANYILAAADKGTRIEFNTSGSVTCTVNSGLFDAGDTLVIQNRGAGVVTVTAGTATVNTSATLALSQYDAGTLYFISDSASIFFNTDAGGGSPLTTKGDLYGFSTVDARIPIGANDTVLTADSSQSLGLKWAAPAGGYTSLATGTLSSSQVDITSISGSYRDLVLIIRNYKPANDNSSIYWAFNADRNNRYDYNSTVFTDTAKTFGSNFMVGGRGNDNSVATGLTILTIPDYANTTTWKIAFTKAIEVNATTTTQYNFYQNMMFYNQTAAISQINILDSGGSFTSGDYVLFGVK